MYFILVEDFNVRGMDLMTEEDLHNFYELLTDVYLFKNLTDDQKKIRKFSIKSVLGNTWKKVL